MKKYILQIITILIICAILIVPLNFLFKNNKGHYIYRMMEEMYECPENIDVLFLGSSHVYRAYDTKLADKLLGVKTYNAGSSSQLMDQSFYLLKEIAKANDLKTVYLDTVFMVTAIASSGNDNSVYMVSDYMKLSLNKIDYLWHSGGVKTLCEGLLPIRRDIVNINLVDNIQSRNMEPGDYSNISYDNEEYRGEGFVYSYESVDADHAEFDQSEQYDLTKELPMSPFSYKFLLKIIEFCKENQIELVMVSHPMPAQMLHTVKGYDNYVRFMYDIAEQYDIGYRNYNLYKEEINLTIKDFKDVNHLNGEGAEKYTELFCNDIIEIEKNGKKETELFDRTYNGTGVF